ncbi:hypothetical protein ACQP2T_60655 [Nonomuraea sp. CA-143628]|uniref:hypothetical protein n=1 Tax=Nonomuraea sp. CA-143628 TaxID=3239997 RepID=UPI003D924714
MRHRRRNRVTSQHSGGKDEYPDDEKGTRWAAELQNEYGKIVFVLWEVAGKHLTAFYKGPTPEGIWVKGRTPQELRQGVSARLGELRLAAFPMQNHPVINEILPGLSRRHG